MVLVGEREGASQELTISGEKSYFMEEGPGEGKRECTIYHS